MQLSEVKNLYRNRMQVPPQIHNFNAGPSILPKTVMEEAAEAVINFNGSGLSILEIGHRTGAFEAVMEEARQLVRELMQLSADQEVLFLHGGATTQFMQVPMNLLDLKGCAGYTDTGIWGAKAIKEASLFGRAETVCSSRDNAYRHIPKDFAVPQDCSYLHITTNNTVYGTQWQKMPATGNPIVADMSSDIFSRVLDFKKFGLIYAGAQKNMGAAGVNLVVVNKNLLGKVKRKIPSILDYRLHIEAGSMLNTPPVFAVYVSLLTLRWIKASGGIAAMEKNNKVKAKLLYGALDHSKAFEPTVEKADRSRVNICFTIKEREDEELFAKFAHSRGIIGIAGHRTTGGFRASLYNALPIESVEALVQVLKDWESGAGRL